MYFELTREYTVNNFNVYTNIANTLEYFATAFACYINYPDDLYTYCPDTYNYFNSFFNKEYVSIRSYCRDPYI